MSRFGLIGNPISHSKSPALFSQAYSSGIHTYELVEADTVEKAMDLFCTSDLKGVNVTSPFKDEVMRYVTNPSRVSSLLGSANVLIKEEQAVGGKFDIYSYNTDYYGVKNTIAQFLESHLLPDSLKSKSLTRVAVIGAGGAGKAAVLAMADSGFEVSLVNRSAGKVAEFAGRVGAVYVPLDGVRECVERADLVIYSLSFLLEQLEDMDWSEKVVFEANYAKAALSPENGVKCGLYIDGRYWLYHQAVPAFKLFTNQEPDCPAMKKIMGIE